MLIEAVRRVEAAAREMLAAVNGGTMSCAEAREVLAACKSAVAVMSAAQTTAASVVAEGGARHERRQVVRPEVPAMRPG